MSKNKLLGKVLWWSNRDQNGVLTDSRGNEYYFDCSVVGLKAQTKLERGTLVLFEPSRCDKVLTAKSLNLPSTKVLSKYQAQYELEEKQLSLPFAV